MEIQTLIKEVRLFLKEYMKKIIVLTGVIVTIGIILQVSLYFLDSQSQDNTKNGITPVHTASFEIYIEQNNIGAFTNSYLIEEYLKQENVVKKIEKSTNLAILPILNEYEETHTVITTTDEDPINVFRNTSTNILTVSFGIGTEEEDLETAEAYYSWLQENDFQFFDDKIIYYISSPESTEDFINEQENSPSIIRLIINLVLVVFGGIILGIALSLIKTLFNKKINYAFTYSWDEKDVFLNYTDEYNATKIVQSILHPYLEKKVVISEQPISEEIIETINKVQQGENILFVSELSTIDPKLEIDEVIIVIYRNETLKKWYQNQRKQLKNYPNTTIKIIQL
ncbi:hypothetical protein [Carnobacterium funditum]|uniref:hypothetical protein n=1 Tax=Carnobacterium funditum TaxID=2752 RepID=UPI0005519771|nr:hypothetical protein [Carnobacterium funditum]